MSAATATASPATEPASTANLIAPPVVDDDGRALPVALPVGLPELGVALVKFPPAGPELGETAV